MGKIKNMTPHEICLYRQEDCEYDHANRKWFAKDGAAPVQVLPPSGQVLNAKVVNEADLGVIDGFPVRAVVWEADPLPPGEDLFIVSALYKQAATEADKIRLLTIGSPVYKDRSNPRPVGCLSLLAELNFANGGIK
jgi:hypothetical protein